MFAGLLESDGRIEPLVVSLDVSEGNTYGWEGVKRTLLLAHPSVKKGGGKKVKKDLSHAG